MRFFQSLIICLLFTACQQSTSEENNVAFYFSGHPDDWQLFMGDKAWQDVQDKQTRTVFVITTAGDAAMGMNASETANKPYYLAREKGYINSLMWAAGGEVKADTAGRSTIRLADYELETELINGHAVKSFDLSGLKAYLLYLPDGFPQGQHTWSLQKLKEGVISDMPAIDSTAFYQDWNDLKAMVRAIIEAEVGDTLSKTLWLNLADTDTTVNRGDHSDHLHTSLLAQEASEGLCVNYRFYSEYITHDMPANLAKEATAIKKFVFSANALAKEEAGYNTPWEPYHLSWTGRGYYREELCEKE